jgi:RNA polymerase sigma-70 factor (ECF subfamily)
MAFDPRSASNFSPVGATPVEGRRIASMKLAAGPRADPHPDPDIHADTALLARAAQGDAQACAALYRQHARAVYRFAWLLSGNESAAADVVQDTFLSLIDGATAFDPARGSVAAYLCGIARHRVYRALRQRIDAVEDIDAYTEARDERADEIAAPDLPQDALERRRALAQLHAAVRALPAYYRDVLVLVELQEMSYADAAGVVGIEVGTVRSRLARAKARLARALAGPLAVDTAEK